MMRSSPLGYTCWLLLLTSTQGCDGESSSLHVDLKTDLVAGVEFTRIHAELISEGITAMDRSVTVEDSFVTGGRVADFESVEPGTRTVRVTLFDAGGRQVQDRQVIVEVSGSTAVTVIITRDCRAITCPGAGDESSFTACFGGRCVDPRCSPETPELCPTVCAGDSDCMVTSACAVGRCDEGVCLAVASAGACPSTEVCVPDVGCVPATTADGGPGDAGSGPHVLEVVIDGDSEGSVTSVPPGIDCPGSCEAAFPQGTSVTLTAVPSAATAFDGWSHAACPDPGPCSLTIEGPTVVHATLSRRNAVFVLVTGQAVGDLGGLAGADALCNSAAATAGLAGDHVAWLSTSTISAIDRLSGARGWLRSDNAPFADTVDDIRSGRILHPIALEADGTRPSPWRAMTATHDDYTPAPLNCADFTDTGLSHFVITGNIYGTTADFTDDESAWRIQCDEAATFYCFGVDLARAVEIEPVEGRLAFLAGPWASGAGLSDAHAHCQTEAARAGLPGTYRALLRTSSSTAADLFDDTGPPWVRVDGVPIATTATLFLSGDWNTALNVTADGRYQSGRVWTLPTSMTPASSHCSDWIANSSMETAIQGRASVAPPERGGPWIVGCDQAAPIGCLQD